MPQIIQARNKDINFTNFEDLANKEIFTSGNTQVYANSILRDPSTGKIDTNTVITFNTTSNDKSDKLTTPALLLNWSGAEIEFNGTTYTINTTPELLEALIDAGQVSPILNDSNLPIRTSVVTEEFSYLGEAIGELAQIASEKMADWE